MEPLIKYVRSKGQGGGQGKNVHLCFMMPFYCLKAYKGGGVSESHHI